MTTIPKLSAAEIEQAIIGRSWTQDEISSAFEVLKFVSQKLNKATKSNFKVGNMVSFTTNNGETIKGTVDKIFEKNIQVSTSAGKKWK